MYYRQIHSGLATTLLVLMKMLGIRPRKHTAVLLPLLNAPGVTLGVFVAETR